ncbi:MAG: serine/threonine-protein kinase [Candidatus Krumholzibacteriia bacterium]
MADRRQPPEDHEDREDLTRVGDSDATLAGGGAAHLPGERPGTMIGRYRLIRPLGEGGFGTVFLAEQLEPVSREVALKVIKLGMDTRQVIARFEAERQALAMMDHPGIAKVFDAGATGSGRPYFVMELVKGEPITDYCDRRRLRTRQRLELFTRVCAAVQHAHQKGIIHRDIKPSNVLVTEVEGAAAPKVIDFGIAKATRRRLTEKTIFTQEAQFVGTPAYMSPEQAESSDLDIDTRSDIYSLGVLLYELLAGATPFDSTRLLSAGYGEIQRIIREVDPPRPSARVSGLGDQLEATAEQRRLHGAQLVRRLRGDLDWIVMMCLEKDRARRYETANGLARDVERFLANEPVTASPPSRRYRLRKLIRRNRAVFAVGLAMALLLTAGIVGTSVGLVRARQAEREAVTAAATSDRVAMFLTDMLEGVGPSAARGRDTEMLEEILQETRDKLGTELAGEPAVEGTIRSFLGTTYFDLGRYEDAREQYELARDLFTTAHGENHPDVAQQYGSLGLTLEALQDFPAAEAYDRRALALRLALFGEMDAAVGESKLNLANLLVNDARYDEAEPLLREALAIQRRTLGEEHEDIAISLNSLGNLMQHLERYDEAGPYYEEALAMHTRLLGADHPYVITDRVNLGWLSYNLGDNDAAARHFGDALTLGRRVYGAAHPKLVEMIAAQAATEHKRGRDAESETLYHEAWDMAAAVHGPDDILTSAVIDGLCDVLKDQGRDAEWITLQERVWAIQKRELGERDPTTITTQQNLAWAYYKQDDLDEALPRLRAARDAYVEVFGLESAQTAQVINNLGRALRDHGDLDEAATVLTEAAAIRARVLGADHLHVQVVNFDLAMTRRAQGRLEDAARLMDDVLVGYYANLDSTHWVVGQALLEEAEVLLAMNRDDEALAAAQRAHGIVAAAYGENSEKVLPFDAVLIAALGRTGDLVGADARLAAVTPRLAQLGPRKRALVEVRLGPHLALAGRHAEAESMLLAAHATLDRLHGGRHFETQRAVRALVELYDGWTAAGSTTAREAARRWRERLLAGGAQSTR